MCYITLAYIAFVIFVAFLKQLIRRLYASNKLLVFLWKLTENRPTLRRKLLSSLLSRKH